MKPSRRQILKGLGATQALSGAALSVAQSEPQSTQGGAPKPPLIIFARHLEWAQPDEAVEFAAAAGFDGIGWCVRASGHVVPENVEKDLPRVVELARKAGLVAPVITTSIYDAAAPRAESILATMKGVGITEYRSPAVHYDYSRDFGQQLDELKLRIATLAKLNARHGVTAMYHTHSYPGLVGGAAWDLWMMIRDMDPKLIAVHYDIGHVTVKGGLGWYDSAHALGSKFLRSVSLHDFQWVHFPSAPFRTRWSPKFCRPGDGIVDFLGFFQYLKSIGYTAPIEAYFEYEVPSGPNFTPVNLLGTGYGKWKLEIPKKDLLAYMQRDVKFYKGLMREAELI